MTEQQGDARAFGLVPSVGSTLGVTGPEAQSVVTRVTGDAPTIWIKILADRTWRQRWLSWPWRPWVTATGWTQESYPPLPGAPGSIELTMTDRPSVPAEAYAGWWPKRWRRHA